MFWPYPLHLINSKTYFIVSYSIRPLKISSIYIPGLQWAMIYFSGGINSNSLPCISIQLGTQLLCKLAEILTICKEKRCSNLSVFCLPQFCSLCCSQNVHYYYYYYYYPACPTGRIPKTEHLYHQILEVVTCGQGTLSGHCIWRDVLEPCSSHFLPWVATARAQSYQRYNQVPRTFKTTQLRGC